MKFNNPHLHGRIRKTKCYKLFSGMSFPCWKSLSLTHLARRLILCSFTRTKSLLPCYMNPFLWLSLFIGQDLSVWDQETNYKPLATGSSCRRRGVAEKERGPAGASVRTWKRLAKFWRTRVHVVRARPRSTRGALIIAGCRCVYGFVVVSVSGVHRFA